MERRSERRNAKRKMKKWQIVLIVIAAILLVIAAAAAIIINTFLSKINYDDPYHRGETGGDILTESVDPITEGVGDAPEVLPEFDVIAESKELFGEEDRANGFDLSRLDEYQDMVRHWTNNGRPISSDKVINILLIGMDGGSLSTNARADAIVLVSVNTETKKIYLTSLLRDCYTYNTDGEKEIFEKLNLTNTRGGPEMLIDAIERHYKIAIDNYLAVSLETFPEVVDTLGGIDINVTEAEAVAIEIRPGYQTLDGEKALRYARIRKIDSDYARTGRHQVVLQAMLDKAKKSGASGVLDLINSLLPSVRTGFTKSDVLGLGFKAVTSGWMNYDVVTNTYPPDDTRIDQTVDELFYWIVEYPRAAQSLQNLIYGKSNIVLK